LMRMVAIEYPLPHWKQKRYLFTEYGQPGSRYLRERRVATYKKRDT
jgi:hypothetical protein